MTATLTAVGGLLAVCLALWAVVKLADRDTEESDAELLAWIEELRDNEEGTGGNPTTSGPDN